MLYMYCKLQKHCNRNIVFVRFQKQSVFIGAIEEDCHERPLGASHLLKCACANCRSHVFYAQAGMR